jgi:hypothetical protein
MRITSAAAFSHSQGHFRRFRAASSMSGLPPYSDIPTMLYYFSIVPTTEEKNRVPVAFSLEIKDPKLPSPFWAVRTPNHGFRWSRLTCRG